jgi:hypothetical protein
VEYHKTTEKKARMGGIKERKAKIENRNGKKHVLKLKQQHKMKNDI